MVLQLGELRVRLDQMTERIVSRLKDRSRFPLNEAVYRPDGVPIASHSGISFLEFSLEGLETYHASLGRYNYPDQYSVFSSQHEQSPVSRTVGRPAVPVLRLSIKDDLLTFYESFLRDLCPPDEDADTYGETVYVDADLLSLLHERINVGRYVAYAKATSDPSVFAVANDETLLSTKLRDVAREEALIATTRTIGARYELDPNLVERVFRWIVQETLTVEVAYLQQMRATPTT